MGPVLSINHNIPYLFEIMHVSHIWIFLRNSPSASMSNLHKIGESGDMRWAVALRTLVVFFDNLLHTYIEITSL